MVESKDFFKRVCEAFGISPGRGAKAYIAKETGNSDTAVAKWEKGGLPDLDNVERIANKTGSSLHWLLTGEGPRTVEDLKAATEPIINRANLENIVRRIVLEEVRRLRGAPSFEVDLKSEERKVG